MRSPSLLLWIPAAAFVAACASGTNPAFLDANAAYRAAAGDPKVTANAPVELHDAQQALDRAAQAQDDRKSDDEIEHLSYLARRRVEIAEARADQKVAEQSSEALADQKDAVLLDARKREVDALTRELAELKARETDRGIELTVGDVLFDVGQASLKPGATTSLGRLAAFLREHPDRKVLIEGHTDSSGTPSYNLDLSLARADSVARALVGDGVDGDRISPRGFGESTPVASNDSAAGRLQNRRVEIVVVPAPEPVANPKVGSAR
jgi:outer membrane protein OmpA-like peptidoglycan-associated protein